MIHINEITFKEDGSKWTKQFNYCSELYAKANDQALSQEERDKYQSKWQIARWELETGAHND